jgi:hypothetical protein
METNNFKDGEKKDELSIGEQNNKPLLSQLNSQEASYKHPYANLNDIRCGVGGQWHGVILHQYK